MNHYLLYKTSLLLLCIFGNISTRIINADQRWLRDDHLYNDNVEEINKRSNEDSLNIKMPKVSPPKHDTYYCTAIKMPTEDTYVVGYEPHAKMDTAHHMLMFGCDEVSQYGNEDYWNCGEMGGTCSGQVNNIIYAWAKDAPPLKLPKDVGFHVGGSGRIKYIVLQVHYANVDKFKDGHYKDQSGVTINTQAKKPKYFAGIYLVAAGGPPIPPKLPVFHMDMACRYTVGPEMYPFAFRVHAHKLGKVVTGFILRGNTWTMIGKGDPQRPQAFYESQKQLSLQPGDILAARCTYDSLKRDTTTYIGATGSDEMCNFYTMYFYNPSEGYSTDSCETIFIPDEEFPNYTDTPLPPMKEMEMKRNIENEKPLLSIVEDWPEGRLSNDHHMIGQISGIAVNSDGDVVLFHRGDRVWGFDTFDAGNRLNQHLRRSPIMESPVVVLKKETGGIIKTWGKGIFYFPHGLTIDHDDNMWFTDVGMHQVFKFSRNGQLLLTLGEKFVPGSDFRHFCKPTDVAVERNGDFFVSDGYCNSRVIKYSADGKQLFVINQNSLSSLPSFPAPLKFIVPHSVSLYEDLLYLADRENGRILAFKTTNGEFFKSYTGFGEKVFAITAIRDLLFVINGKTPSGSDITGFTFDLTSEEIIQQWKPPKGFVYPHDVTADKAGKFVYVSEITTPGKVWKFERI